MINLRTSFPLPFWSSLLYLFTFNLQFDFTFSFIALGTLCPMGGHFCSKSRKENKFPDDFLWGAASSAYQIEGAWNVDGINKILYANIHFKISSHRSQAKAKASGTMYVIQIQIKLKIDPMAIRQQIRTNFTKKTCVLLKKLASNITVFPSAGQGYCQTEVTQILTKPDFITTTN